MSTKEELGALKVTELKTLCKEKGTSKGGPLRPAFLSFTTSLLEVEDVE